ncbi:MAG TPA: hypothetical protein VJ925_13430 [Longimicrobiales bacterium]|nr:hypothetical protein [Longimicrobiales bacterium]
MNAKVLVRGLIAGALGATVIAVFFLILDVVQGTPFATPGFMAEALLDTPGAAGVPAYTVLHYTSFLVMGMTTAWALHRLDVNSPLPIGLALGGMLFAFIFYGAVLLNGADVVSFVGWPSALVANLLAGVAMVVYCDRAAGRKGPTAIGRILSIPWVREGLILGLSTAALVAVWMLIIDALTTEPFFTAGALGSAMILGAANSTEIVVNAATVLGYTLYHGAIFTAIGLVTALIVSKAEEAPSILIAGVLLFAVFEALTAGLVSLVANYLLGTTAWWGLMGGNLIAAAWLAWQISRRHPYIADLLSRRELSSESG